MIEVEDCGPGIPTTLLPEIFAPFAQVGGAAAQQGLGLGLSIAREIARAHDGDVEARSIPGEGATIAVRLPLREVGSDGSGGPAEPGT